MHFTIPQGVFIAQVKTVLNQPICVVDAIHCPLGAGVIAERSPVRLVGRPIRLRESAVPVPPLVGSDDGEHLTAL